jgi:hypothetical protein
LPVKDNHDDGREKVDHQIIITCKALSPTVKETAGFAAARQVSADFVEDALHGGGS